MSYDWPSMRKKVSLENIVDRSKVYASGLGLHNITPF